MSEVTRTLLKHGIIPGDCIRELRKWGSPLPTDNASDAEVSCVEDITRELSEAFTSKEQSQFRTTDLDVCDKFKKEKIQATVKIPTVVDTDVQVSVDDISETETPIEMAWLEETSVAIPWTTDDLSVWEYLIENNAEIHITDKKYALIRAEPVFIEKNILFVRCQVEEVT